MLSGEVAQGKYPVESVRTMMTIIKEADTLLEECHKVFKCEPSTSDVESIASSVVKTAAELNATLIVVLTDTGFTARMVAKYKPNVPVMCYATCRKVGRQLQLHRGLYPVVSSKSTLPTLAEAIANAKRMGWVKNGEKVVMLSADQLSSELGKQIVMRVAEVM